MKQLAERSDKLTGDFFLKVAELNKVCEAVKKQCLLFKGYYEQMQVYERERKIQGVTGKSQQI